MKRKNYDNLNAELTLLERIQEIREQAKKSKRNSPDIRTMYGFQVESNPATLYFFDTAEKRDKKARLFNVKKIIEPCKNIQKSI
jgi:hypothetical protein